MAKSTPSRRGASRSSSKKQGRRQVPGWVWLFAGVMVGLFVAFLVHLGDVQMQQGAPDGTQQASSTSEQDDETTASKNDDNGQPKFDFYAVLPKMEVIVPKSSKPDSKNSTAEAPQDNDTSSNIASNNDNTSPPADDDKRYMLQAGSFRDEADADRRRAKLTLRGFDVSIQSAQLDNGDTWHRVMVGPYNTLTALRTDQDTLIKQGVETLPIQIKAP